MDREWGAQDALAFVRRTDFAPSDIAFDAAMQRSERVTGLGAPGDVAAGGERREIGVGMLGYAFMGKAHSNAFKKIAYMTWPPPLVPRLVSIAGRNEAAVAERGASATATSAGRPTGATSSPTRRSGSSTTAARTRCTPSRRSPPPRPASTSSARSRSAATADESYEIWQRVAATGVKHLCAFNYRFVPAIRLAREMIEAGELGEIRHFRGRYLQDWGDDPTLDTWRFHADEAGLRRARRPRRARRRPRPVPRRRVRGGVGSREDVPPGREVDDAIEAAVAVRERRRRHDRGDAARARAPERVPVGDQRLEGLARVRHGAAERAAGVPRRRRPARAASRPCSSRSPTTRSGSTGGRPATSSAGARRSSTRSTTSCARSRRTRTSRPYGATFEDGYRAAEVCDAIVRSSETGARERIVYRSI